MNKNIIYKVVGVVVLLLVGEGIFGWAVYWSVLWFLLSWNYVYWLAFGLGFLLVGFLGYGMGWTSLVLVLGVWLMRTMKGLIGKNVWLEWAVVVVVAWLADISMSVKFSLTEILLIILMMVVLKIKSEREEVIKI